MLNREWFQLFFAWSAFVFIPFNLLAGTLINKNYNSTDAIIGIIAGAIILLFFSVPSVWYASLTGRSFVEGVDAEVEFPAIRFLLKITLPIINIGWFAIQTIAAVNLLPLQQNSPHVFLCAASISFLFIIFPLIYGYSWLHKSGMIAISSLFFSVLIIVSGHKNELMWASPNSLKIFNVATLVIGTWIFSSTTCVMDIARHVRNPYSAISAILIGTIVADICLLLIGQFFSSSTQIFLNSRNRSDLMGIVSNITIFIALWSTNDSNFYSTDCALRKFGVPSWLVSSILVFFTGLAATLIGDNLFGIIGAWLQFMGWIGIPFGFFWLTMLIKITRSQDKT